MNERQPRQHQLLIIPEHTVLLVIALELAGERVQVFADPVRLVRIGDLLDELREARHELADPKLLRLDEPGDHGLGQ